MKRIGKSILVLMFGQDAPSTRFRWLDYQERFVAAGWEIDFCTIDELQGGFQLQRYDVVVLQKTMVSPHKFRWIRKHADRLVYDVDDRIWLRQGRPYRAWSRWKIDRRMRMIAAQSDLCIAANSVIASDLRQYGAEPVIVPMALDPERWQYRQPDGKPPVIGWTGGPKNLSFLEPMAPVLRKVQQNHACRIVIHCGQDPELMDLEYQYEPFESGRESQVVSTFDIGLCPLPDDPFSCGKSPIKSLQYLASGAAVVASPRGAVRDILEGGKTVLWAETEQEWTGQLERLLSDVPLMRLLADQGRRQLEENFSARVVFQKLDSLLSAYVAKN